MKPQTELERIRAHIEAHDRLVTQYGMEVEEVVPGGARVSMTVTEDHLNAAGLCHGAVFFALGDVAFALASNSHGRMALALEVSVNYLRPAKAGERIVAQAKELNLGKTTGLYEIEIKAEDGRLLAFFKATAFRFQDRSVLG